MDVYRAIVSKRDTRHFAERAVPGDVLRRILQAGRMAGSSKNSQPCRFIVVERPQRKKELAQCGKYADHIPGCPVAIAVVLTPGGGAFDAGRAAQNMMIAGWDEGVTSCPTTMHEADSARRALGLPADHTVAIVLAMGYPKEDTALGLGRQRAPLDDVVRYDHWS